MVTISITHLRIGFKTSILTFQPIGRVIRWSLVYILTFRHFFMFYHSCTLTSQRRITYMLFIIPNFLRYSDWNYGRVTFSWRISDCFISLIKPASSYIHKHPIRLKILIYRLMRHVLWGPASLRINLGRNEGAEKRRVQDSGFVDNVLLWKLIVEICILNY